MTQSSDMGRRLRRLARVLGPGEAIAVTDEADCRYLAGLPIAGAVFLVFRRGVIITAARMLHGQLGRIFPRAQLYMPGVGQGLMPALRRAGISSLRCSPQTMTLAARDALSRAAGMRLKPGRGQSSVSRLRMVKDPAELRCCAAAGRIAARAVAWVGRWIRPGMTERDVSRRLQMKMFEYGADSIGFEPIVAAGRNSSFPHYATQSARIPANGPVLIDCGCGVRGYNSDLTRVIFLGKITNLYNNIYQIVALAHRRAVEYIRPGRLCSAIDAHARDIIVAHGYGAYFTHVVGHGVGLEVHEEPHLGPKAQGELVPGMVVTVEPGIYLPGRGGVRIEDTLVVTRTGSAVLTRGSEHSEVRSSDGRNI